MQEKRDEEIDRTTMKEPVINPTWETQKLKKMSIKFKTWDLGILDCPKWFINSQKSVKNRNSKILLFTYNAILLSSKGTR